MEFPAFYDPARVNELYMPDLNAAFRAGYEVYRQMGPQSCSAVKRGLLITDLTISFQHLLGELQVPGSRAVVQNTVELLLTRPRRYAWIAAFHDSHPLDAISGIGGCCRADGSLLDSGTILTMEMVDQGKIRMIAPGGTPMMLRAAVRNHYETNTLPLFAWQLHGIGGTIGSALMPALSEAIVYASAAVGHAPLIRDKAVNGDADQHGPFSLYGKWMNEDILDLMRRSNVVDNCGIALEICLLTMLEQEADYFSAEREVVERLRVIRDCTCALSPEGEAKADARIADLGIGVTTTAEIIRQTA